MTEPSPSTSGAPEAFAPLLPKRMIAPDRQAALDAMTTFMALTRSIADDAKMPPHLKVAHLTALEGALTTEEGYVPLPKGVPPTIMSPGFTLRRVSDERGIPVIYGRRVVQAYRQDLTKKAYRDWSDLLVYLRYSAGASAQYTLEALGLDKALAPAIEALASAHALLARMESIGSDLGRGRLYLPQRWLQSAGIDVEEPTLGSKSERWLKVRDQGVAQARKLLIQGAPCVKAVTGWRLKLAFAWAKAGLDRRCDALASAHAFPTTAPAPSSNIRRALAMLPALFR